MIVGLWLTPYLLRHLGSHDYGLWLLGAQVLVYLALMDLGIVQLVPRDVAIAAGLPNGDASRSRHHRSDGASRAVAGACRRARWAVLSCGCSRRSGRRCDGRSAIVVRVCATFPLRVFNAVLQGLQDLAFLGTTHSSAWAAGAVVTIAASPASGCIRSRSAGSTTQLVSSPDGDGSSRPRTPDVLPARLPSLAFSARDNRSAAARGSASIRSRRCCSRGTDLVVIGKLLGPEAVVPYACTGKLLTMLANQPQMFMQMALPALSELRTAAPREHLFDVARSMAQVMLLQRRDCGRRAGDEPPFVPGGWVSARFAGVGLTALLLRHAHAPHELHLIYTLFCFGYERRLALTAVADGSGPGDHADLVPLLGVYGAVLGSLSRSRSSACRRTCARSRAKRALTGHVSSSRSVRG